MTTTTSYGTWANHGGGGLTVADSITEALGEFAGDYDTEAIEVEYREAINEALPDGVTLDGDEFYGPYYEADQDFDGYPLDDFGGLDIKTIVEFTDFWAITERHDTAA